MTREEIKDIPKIVDFLLGENAMAEPKEKLHKRLEEVCNLAIKALERETDILDKVKAEIEGVMWEEKYEHPVLRVDPDDVLEIIDKYRKGK